MRDPDRPTFEISIKAGLSENSDYILVPQIAYNVLKDNYGVI